MTTAGYLFMGLAWAAISGLTVFCYKKILWDK
jgi:hypothetical protein